MSQLLELTRLHDFCSPQGLDLPKALSRSQVIAVGAHPDDLEFMCLSAIERARQGTEEEGFFGLIVSNGLGSPRGDGLQDYSDEQFTELRRQEQREAAKLSGFCGVLQLNYPSSKVKDSSDDQLRTELKLIWMASPVRSVFTHSPFDRHATHRATCMHVLSTLKTLPKTRRPRLVIGCEVWRSLDWVPEKYKRFLPVKSTEPQMRSLFSIYQSQISGAKNYVDAVIGRKRCNATFREAHSRDAYEFCEVGIDLTSIVSGKTSLQGYAEKVLSDFRTEIRREIKADTGKTNGNHHSKKPSRRISGRSRSGR